MLQKALVEWQKAKAEEKELETKTPGVDDKKDRAEEDEGEPLPEARRALDLLYDDTFECRSTKVSVSAYSPARPQIHAVDQPSAFTCSLVAL